MQDYKLNLIVCGRLTDPIGNNTYSAVYKLDMFEANHQIAQAKIDTILPKSAFDYLRPEREFTSAGVFSDNSYFIGRKGPVNSNPVDPDNAILQFIVKDKFDGTTKDTLIGKVAGFEPLGTGLLSANEISSITTFNNNLRDIIISLTGENSFKVQWLNYVETSDFTGYQNRLPEFASDMMLPGRFSKPMDVALDPANNIYVVDADKDSLLKFNAFGEERESFGGPEVFNSPSGVAYFNKILYVADTDNNRILRFVLSTDI
jgi:DNA-binding beta-propeller fold protein YncE